MLFYPAPVAMSRPEAPLATHLHPHLNCHILHQAGTEPSDIDLLVAVPETQGGPSSMCILANIRHCGASSDSGTGSVWARLGLLPAATPAKGSREGGIGEQPAACPDITALAFAPHHAAAPSPGASVRLMQLMLPDYIMPSLLPSLPTRSPEGTVGPLEGIRNAGIHHHALLLTSQHGWGYSRGITVGFGAILFVLVRVRVPCSYDRALQHSASSYPEFQTHCNPYVPAHYEYCTSTRTCTEPCRISAAWLRRPPARFLNVLLAIQTGGRAHEEPAC